MTISVNCESVENEKRANSPTIPPPDPHRSAFEPLFDVKTYRSQYGVQRALRQIQSNFIECFHVFSGGEEGIRTLDTISGILP